MPVSGRSAAGQSAVEPAVSVPVSGRSAADQSAVEPALSVPAPRRPTADQSAVDGVPLAPSAATPVASAPACRRPTVDRQQADRPATRAHVVARPVAAAVAVPIGAHPVPAPRLPAPRRAGAATAAPAHARVVPPPPPFPSRGPLRFAALGDSLSEGVGDRVDGAWRGWAALLAAGLGGPAQHVDFRNFAVSGAQSRDVAEEQAAAATAFRPDLASVVVGVNDTLRRTFDIERFARRLDRVCGDLAGLGAVLLTACLPDPGRMLGLPAPLARPLARRQKAVNTLVHAVSARYGAVHLHLADLAWTDDRSLWSADRLHPGERGHRAIAAGFHALLAAQGLAQGAPPSPEPDQRPPSRADALLWLATAGTGWVARRCHDLLPQLLQLAGIELRHWAAGTDALLDRRAEQALAAAIAAVSLEGATATMGK
ncbi:SGNH/GDSL hydrolase family protein [Streptomyces sp. NPDC006551]|uniref:SGNH/GDSL hydrolase family protein n=1 Tax=Streptomyces sp. NPDC006551 TaxID=3157178 RepID=UPI0033AB7F79